MPLYIRGRDQPRGGWTAHPREEAVEESDINQFQATVAEGGVSAEERVERICREEGLQTCHSFIQSGCIRPTWINSPNRINIPP